MIAIIKKELRFYFTSAPGYIFLAGFLFMNALFFVMNNINALSSNYMATLGSMTIVFLIIIPILTMQLFAEETKQRTDQLLFTAPIPIWKITLAKYIGALTLFLLAMGISVIFPFIMTFYGDVSASETFGIYLGFILLGAGFIAVGLFISCLTNNPIVAAIGSFAALFLMYILNNIALSMPQDRLSSAIFLGVCVLVIAYVLYDATKNYYAPIVFGILAAGAGVLMWFMNVYFFDALILRVLNWFSVLHRFGSFTMGVLALADAVYYVTFAAAFIYLTINTLEKRRWK